MGDWRQRGLGDRSYALALALALLGGMVFPLGMYTASSWRMAEALDVPALFALPRVFIYVALAAWLAAFMGLLIRVASLLLFSGNRTS